VFRPPARPAAGFFLKKSTTGRAGGRLFFTDGDSLMRDYKQISLQSVSKAYGDKVALQDFTAVFNKGEFVTFLGPSGCGKSTALNCISGLIPITKGAIYIDEECLDDAKTRIPAEKREFGMVFQNYALFPHLTVHNNIAFGLQLRKIPKADIKQKVEDVLRLVHLEAYENKYPSQLSGGEQQRVAIARCIVLEPRLLMLDEPLSNLDAKLRIDMRYELISLHTRLQISTIYVTHDQSEALALSDRIVVLKAGVIQQTGTPEEIYSKPANLFVADFMGFKNIWSGKIGKLRQAGDTTVIDFDAQGLAMVVRLSRHALSPEKLESLQKAVKKNENIFCAIRPEDIRVGPADENSFTCEINVIEFQGQANSISASLPNNHRVDFRSADPHDVREHIAIHIPAEKIQIFA
jgi:putative spermidine/putrescine transport system ATP-binding protein